MIFAYLYLFSPFQHGFVSGKSCVTQLLEFLDNLTVALDQGDDVDIIYLDFPRPLISYNIED